MKKKEFLLLLALFTFVSADAEVDLATNLLYSVSGDAVTITGYNGTIPENYSLVIPSQIEGKNVTTIAGSAFAAQSHSGCGNITSIELPQTLTSIGELAFQGVNCSTITFPSGITSLPHGVIANNSHLKEICFEGNITSLGSWCFSEDYNVERLVFYANTTPPAGGSSSFYLFNSSLCKVYVPRGSSSNWGSTWYGFEVIEGTLQKDTEGYYLLKTKQNWIEFSAIVLDEPAANARMIADIDLGDDQTTIGSPRNGGTVWYQGTFDGDGHTLTIAYNNTNGEIFTTPFTLIQGATIKNLHIDGTVNTVYAYGGSVASIGRGSNTLKNIWNSVTSVCTMGGWDQMGAFFGVLESGSSMDVSDCLFTGSMSHPGGYSGYFSGGYGPGPNVSNCLVLGEFTGSYGFNGTFTNCYLKHASTTGVTIPTDEQLSDGTIATALGDAWAQDPELGIPLLKIFANEETEQPSEALNGVFTINASGEKVSFAKGNLQKIGSTYQFAEHQYDYFGTDQSGTHRDMYAFLDYSNPDNGESWSMLSNDEWKYLFATRSVTNTLSDGARYTMATLGGTYKGLIIFPDYYTHPEGTDFTPGVFNSNSNYTAQVSLEGWAMMEAAGCVFLPAAGYCSGGSTWRGVGEYVCYMSTTSSGSSYYDPYFTPDGVYLNERSAKETWSSIRLVLRLQPLTYTVPASGVGTFSSEVNIHLPEGLNAHYCKTYYEERSAISVVNISSGVVPANTGVLLSGTPGETFDLYPTPETADELEGNALVAVTKPTHISATKGDYTNFMMKGGKFVKIADESYNVKMPANRAYLPLLSSVVAGANSISIVWDESNATAIEKPAATEISAESRIYNLNGQKLSAPQKGINIINGRKVIVK